MQHRWSTGIAVVGISTLLVGPAIAQSTGTGTKSPGGSPGIGPGTPGPTNPQPAPAPNLPSSAAPGSPSVGTAPGTPIPGSTQPGTGQIGFGGTTVGSGTGAGTIGQASGEHVRSAQQALQSKGMDPGPVDGVMGPRTQSALRAYQKEQNLPQTGQLDDQTRQKLGI